MAYIATHEVDNWRIMPSNEFAEIGETDGNMNFPRIHVVEVPRRGYAILGPNGVYAQANGDRVIQHIEEVYKTLKFLGIKLFTVKGRPERLEDDNA